MEEFQVLLYYVYIPLSSSDCQGLAEWFKEESSRCTGRIRVALDGLNVCIKAKAADISKHMERIRGHELLSGLSKEIDFKIASTSSSSSGRIAKETGFDGLSIRVCKELVTLGPLAEGTSLSNTGVHLTPQEFHQALLDASSSSSSFSFPSSSNSSAVLLDARNLYETRLGRFEVDGIETIDPKTRTFADLPSFIVSNRDLFKDKATVFMYCTGGVRCERSSAFLSETVPGCKVFQLTGGIQRYLETYGGDGLFSGKNFVYDERIGIASGMGQKKVVGRCLACSQPWDDYSSRTRCSACRILILVCDACMEGSNKEQRDTKGFLCEICHEKMNRSNPHQSPIDPSPSPPVHGLSSRRESGIVRLANGCASISSGKCLKPKLRILCLHGFRQTAGSFFGRTIGLRRRLGDDIDWFFVDAPHMLPYAGPSETPLPPEAAAKRCWLLHDQQSPPEAKECSKAVSQSHGLTESLSRIRGFVTEHGPFDGLLGFSQGSAMATILCQLQQEGDDVGFPFRFVILASGYGAKAPSSSPILLPSLHIFGGRNGNEPGMMEADHQVPASESEALLGTFDGRQSLVYRHGQGHIIPCNKQCVGIIKSFLESQVLEETSKIPA